MATEDQQDILETSSDNQGPADAELFAAQVQEELSEHEIFAGDEDYHKLLASQGTIKATATPSQQANTGTGESTKQPIRHRYVSAFLRALVVSIVVIAVILLYMFLKSPLVLVTNWQLPSLAQQTPTTPKPPIQGQIQKPESASPSTQSVSLKLAQDLYLQGDYDKAYVAYDQLRRSLPTGAKEELLKDFLQLKMALCKRNDGEPDQANRLFGTLSQSRSPVVTTLANYHMAYIELQKKQYLKARTRAYQTIALIDAVDFDKTWASSLQPHCHFLIAESLTRHILSLCDADKDLPGKLWCTAVEVDPFTNLNESQIRSLLNSGSEQLSKSLLSPQIQKVERRGASSRWFVVCHGAPIDELLARFAANAALNITWDFSKAPEPDAEKDTIRKRPASMYLPGATTQQFITVAAGHAGLLARLDPKGNVNIFNPADYSSLSEHVFLLTQEAISLWHRFLSVFHGDQHVPNAHFALALLQTRIDQVTDAIAEYKLVANRFAYSSLAPFALLHSSKLKTNLRDYSGARQDLKQLVEQYPESELSEQAYLFLADATMKAGLSHEAGRLYSKVYHLGLSLESQTTSAFGAGRCFYEQKDYEVAVKWLTRYFDLTRDNTSINLYSACLLLGKSNLALGKTQLACDAFEAALGGPAGQLTRTEYIEVVSALVDAKIQQADFVGALATLENTPSWHFSSDEESIEILLLKSRVLRAMGLADEAIAALGDRAQYALDKQAQAAITLELAKCYVAKGNLELARNDLFGILMLVEPGPLAHEIALELADVCLKLGYSSQTISICSQLLDLGPSAPIKQKALNILAAAYRRQKNYDKAALALLGKWNEPEAPQEKMTFDGPAAIDQSLPEDKQNPIKQDS
jgi:tetratricopeptide (TPR) repeat protein